MATGGVAPVLFLFIVLTSSTAVASVGGRFRGADMSLLRAGEVDGPTTYFEVDRPPPFAVGPPACSVLLLNHTFAYTYGKPAAVAAYRPPACLKERGLKSLSGAVLEWSATSAGRQFDRIFGVWLAGAELLRGCTAEPRPNGIVWTVRKDISRHAALLAGDGDLSVYLANLVDSTYTGIYNVTVSLHLYFSSSGEPKSGRPADLILPISRPPTPAAGGLWFEIAGANGTSESSQFAMPRNAYRAVVEVFVSYHQDDEFWYTNPPNEYIAANNLTGVPGNGPFREVLLRLDGDVVGAVWPFTVIYTGGVNPLLWRPITGIGSFSLPSYDVELTPLLGQLNDGAPHEFEFAVTNALDIWYIDANLHLWLDPHLPVVSGGLVEYSAMPVLIKTVSNFTGLDGRFTTAASRRISCEAWLNTSRGVITTRSWQHLEFVNTNVFRGNGTVQQVNQTIRATARTVAKSGTAVVRAEQLHYLFPLRLSTATENQVGDEYSFVSNVSLGFDESRIAGGGSEFAYGTVKNRQNGRGEMRVKKNLVVGGVAGTSQEYKYDGTDGCYWRDVSSWNYTVFSDRSGESCTKPLLPLSSSRPLRAHKLEKKSD